MTATSPRHQERPAPVKVFVAPTGNGFMRDIADWIVEAATASGRDAVVVHDSLPSLDGSINLVVAPHEFFELVDAPTADLQRAAAASVCVCTEQTGHTVVPPLGRRVSPWHRHARHQPARRRRAARRRCRRTPSPTRRSPVARRLDQRNPPDRRAVPRRSRRSTRFGAGRTRAAPVGAPGRGTHLPLRSADHTDHTRCRLRTLEVRAARVVDAVGEPAPRSVGRSAGWRHPARLLRVGPHDRGDGQRLRGRDRSVGGLRAARAGTPLRRSVCG